MYLSTGGVYACEHSGFLPSEGKKAGGAGERVEETRRPLPAARYKARSQGELVF